jgi:hypothetical protein
MKKNHPFNRSIFILILLFLTAHSYGQTGLNFQGVARTNNNIILASQPISLRLSILQGSSTGIAEYVETRRVTTNAQGLFTAVIGDTGAISTLGNFTTINWRNTPKFLKIEMDVAASNNFITMGTTQFQYVAYAQFANSVDAENITGVVPVARGGTGANSLSTLKTALALDKVNNTSDLFKPISTATQTALDLKLNAADTVKYVKQTYLDSALLTKLIITGNAATATSATTATSAGTASNATKLTTARTINGVAFDGSADITITSTADAGTLTGATLKSTVTGSSLTSVGTLANLTVTNPIVGSITGNAATATSATTATSAGTASNATKLATARNINGVAFDGSGDITITSTADAGTLTGTTLRSTITSSSLTSLGTLTTLTVINPIIGSITGSATTASTAGNITATNNNTLTTLPNLTTIGTITTGTWSGTAINAGNLTGTMLASNIVSSSITRVGVLTNTSVNGKLVVGAASEMSNSAILEANSTTKGFLPPRMGFLQRDAIINAERGLLIFCKDCGFYGELQIFNGINWTNITGGTRLFNINEKYVPSFGDYFEGGMVAYLLTPSDPGYEANYYKGFILALNDVENGKRVPINISPYINAYNSFDNAIGSGSTNTDAIIARLGNTTNHAAGLARSYRGGGFTDWYLPSASEISAIYEKWNHNTNSVLGEYMDYLSPYSDYGYSTSTYDRSDPVYPFRTVLSSIFGQQNYHTDGGDLFFVRPIRNFKVAK